MTDTQRQRNSFCQQLYDSMTELFALHELVTDEGGRAVDYRILDCNQAFSAITGIARERAIGALASALYGSGVPPYLEIYAEVARSGKPARFEVYFPPMRKHFRIIALPIEGGFATVADDITDHKLVEETLREREHSLRQIAEALPEVFWIRDLASRRITYVSPAYERVWGRPVRELLSHPEYFIESVHPEDRERVTEADFALATGKMIRVDYRILRRDGATRWIRARTFPLVDSRGKHDRVAGIAQDITDLRQAESGLRTMQALLDTVLDQCMGRTGCELFAVVAQLLAAQVPASYCLVARLSDDGQRLQLLGFHGPAGPVGKYSELALAHSPFERTLRQQSCVYPARLQQLFPDDALLDDLGIESYAGIPLVGSARRPLGALGVLGTGPLADEDRERVTFLLRLLALRASSEMERIAAEFSGGRGCPA